ncbi:phage recombination protein Bet [Microbulbifer thermotolerans]|uniref:Phage recombination protein Bet n=1 Tax=Microbulbifer thermotolerans TaxID=252514 RepID=A0AB35HXY8_MICTH|nr:phage recombination protein Bet [Microbulbifer thermotolerans]MCX2780397.1 phage recombination protein Bet [Microbulbifer thermotolerans]MCX2802231.1 phage recombination protein Bet [Microbulbifer thermotolerans]MCX2805931.1 phage recombination protein Bet [Microbulbifer thermotolerans]
MSNQLAVMAQRLNVQQQELQNIIINTVMPSKNVSQEQFVSFLAVANEYKLNPMTKEIYAFPSRGGIQPIVSIDGWLKIINSHPDFDGMTFEDKLNDNGDLVAVTCRMYRKGRTHPVEVTEYMGECRRNTDTWKQWPARMLRHKATIQAARYAFGFSGIVDPDEAERIQSAEAAEKNMGAAQVETINEEQLGNIRNALEMAGMDEESFCSRVRVEALEKLEAHRYDGAMNWLKSQVQGEQQ